MQQDPILLSDVHACRSCRLGELRLNSGFLPTPAMPGKNYRSGGLALYLGAPKADDEKQGTALFPKAFVPLLQQAGLHRDDVLVGTLIRCRPPNDRGKDWPEATTACDPWTAKELAVYNPSVVLLMGGDVIPVIFGQAAKVTAMHGTFAARDERHPWGRRVYMASYSPYAVTFRGEQSGEVAQLIVADLKAAKRMIEELPY